MSSSFPQFGEYSLECEYAFTFFPTNSSATLKAPQIRAGRLTPSWKELSLDDLLTHPIRYAIGNGGDEGESLTVDNAVGAKITITLDIRRNIFEADLWVYVGKKDQGVTKSFDLPPGVRIPFMIYRRTQGGDEEIRDTAAVLQGVFATGSAYGQTVTPVHILSRTP